MRVLAHRSWPPCVHLNGVVPVPTTAYILYIIRVRFHERREESFFGTRRKSIQHLEPRIKSQNSPAAVFGTPRVCLEHHDTCLRTRGRARSLGHRIYVVHGSGSFSRSAHQISLIATSRPADSVSTSAPQEVYPATPAWVHEGGAQRNRRGGPGLCQRGRHGKPRLSLALGHVVERVSWKTIADRGRACVLFHCKHRRGSVGRPLNPSKYRHRGE